MNKERKDRLNLLLRELEGRAQRDKFKEVLDNYSDAGSWSIVSPLDSAEDITMISDSFLEMQNISETFISTGLTSDAACQKVIEDLPTTEKVFILPGDHYYVGHIIVDANVFKLCLKDIFDADDRGYLRILTNDFDVGYFIDDVDDDPVHKDVTRVGR